MKRTILATLLLVACTTSSRLDSKPENFVCRLMKTAAEKATCTPFYTDAGADRTHTALVVLDKTQLYCALSDKTLGVACGPMVQQPQAQQPAAQAAPDQK